MATDPAVRLSEAQLFGCKIATEAFRAFDRWRVEHDPDSNMELLEAALAYARWAETNSIKKYLDRAALTQGRGTKP